MTKVTIANYLIGDLSNRFPITQAGIIDHDIIDVMVDGWQHNRYQVPCFDDLEKKQLSSRQRFLM